MTAIQGFLKFVVNGDPIGAVVSIRYSVGVRNSGVSVNRGSTL